MNSSTKKMCVVHVSPGEDRSEVGWSSTGQKIIDQDIFKQFQLGKTHFCVQCQISYFQLLERMKKSNEFDLGLDSVLTFFEQLRPMFEVDSDNRIPPSLECWLSPNEMDLPDWMEERMKEVSS